MKRTSLLILTLLIACTAPDRDAAEEDDDLAPIGPGSDSSALIPPDTPESRRSPATAAPRDTMLR